jgi:hypothetical protein
MHRVTQNSVGEHKVLVSIQARKNRLQSGVPACPLQKHPCSCEISSSHGGEYDVQSCLLGYTAIILHGSITQKTALNTLQWFSFTQN